MHDVIIIGAGPAGLMAARELEKSKANFLVLDSKKEIGIPLCCGEGVRKDGFVELFGNKKYPFVKNETKGLAVYSGNTERFADLPYLMLDRPAFEKWLSKPILTMIKLQTKVNRITRTKDYAVIHTDKKRYHAKLVIIACGSNFNLQKNVGLAQKKQLLVPCYGGIFKYKNLDSKKLHFYFDDKTATGLWVFPKSKTVANVGIAVVPFHKHRNLKKLLPLIIKKNKLNLTGEPTYGGVFPGLGPIKKTYSDRIMVAGDAGGIIYAGIGEGIYFSLVSGQIAGRHSISALKKNDFSASIMKRYQLEWKKKLGKHIKASVMFTHIFAMAFVFKKVQYMFKRSKGKHFRYIFNTGQPPLKFKIAYYLARIIEPLVLLYKGIKL